MTEILGPQLVYSGASNDVVVDDVSREEAGWMAGDLQFDGFSIKSTLAQWYGGFDKTIPISISTTKPYHTHSLNNITLEISKLHVPTTTAQNHHNLKPPSQQVVSNPIMLRDALKKAISGGSSPPQTYQQPNTYNNNYGIPPPQQQQFSQNFAPPPQPQPMHPAQHMIEEGKYKDHKYGYMYGDYYEKKARKKARKMYGSSGGY